MELKFKGTDMVNILQVMALALFAFIIPIISLFSPHAIATAFVIASVYPAYLFITQNKLKNIWHESVLNKVIIIFLIYGVISTIWTIKPAETLSLWVRLLLLFISTISLSSYLQTVDRKQVIIPLLYGLIFALVIANIEIYTNGFISNLFGLVYKGSGKFETVIFNRGASVISVICWPAIAYLCFQKHYKSAAALFLAVFLTILQMQSLSSTLGLFAGAIILPLVFFWQKKMLKILALLSIITVFSVAAAAKIMDAHKLVGNVPVVPGGASDIRLYIWDYAAEQAYKKPIFGWGLNASRSYPVKPEDYVMGGRHPLPLHPHNNTLQIWLELGAVGLAFFAAFICLTFIRIGYKVQSPIMMAISTALFINYLIIGQVGYGIWQNWWMASIIFSMVFLRLSFKTEK